jgi:hypothetical protein
LKCCTLSYVNLAHTEVYHKTVSGLKTMGNAVRMNAFENVASAYRLVVVT